MMVYDRSRLVVSKESKARFAHLCTREDKVREVMIGGFPAKESPGESWGYLGIPGVSIRHAMGVVWFCVEFAGGTVVDVGSLI